MALRKPPCAFLADDGSQLMLDGVTEYGVDDGAVWTEHTVESGANISDHARRKQRRFNASVRVSASPLGDTLLVGGQRMDVALGWFDLHALQPITIVSQRYGTMSSMGLTSWSSKATVMEHLDFRVEAVQVVFAEAGLVDIPPDAPATEEAATGLPDEVDVGEQATTATDDSTSASATTTTTADEPSEEATDTSVALDILEAMGLEP